MTKTTPTRTHPLKMIVLSALLAIASMHALAETSWLSPQFRDHPLAGVIVDGDGKAVSEDRLLSALTAPFAFVGEKHDNPDHHRIEAELIRARLDKQPGGAVVFEMLDDTQRPALSRLMRGDDLDTIRTKLDWPDKGWDLAVYGPLFQQTLTDGTLVAGNIGKPFIGRLYAEGEPLLADDPRFGSIALLENSRSTRAHLLDRIFDAHCGMQSRDTLQPMLAIQLAKDASMASAMLDAAPAMLIAGGEHVRSDSGVPSHVRAHQPDAGIVVVQLMEVTAGQDDAKLAIKDAGPADFYWFTPATRAEDYCAEVKGRAAH